MTIITEDFADAALAADEVRASFYGVPLRVQSDGTGVITPTPVVVYSVGGTITSPQLDPGPMRVEIDAEGWYQVYDVMIPETGTHRLFELEEIIIAEHKVIVKGDKGDVGAGVNLAGTVANYVELAAISLGPADAGTAYVNNDDGLLYVWSGSAWPANGAGAPFRGLRGKSLASVAIQGNKLLFGLDDSTALGSVTVPALAQAATDATAANAAKTAAQGAQAAAETAAANADADRIAAESSKTAAAGSASAAAGSATAADSSKTAAAGSATAAAGSATAAAASQGAVDTAKSQVDTALAAAQGARDDALDHKVAAETSANTATVKANAAAQSAVDADAARVLAQQAAADAQSAGGVATTRKVEGTGDLVGGGDLSADRTLDLTSAAKVKLEKGGTSSQPGHTHAVTDVVGLAEELGSALMAKADLIDGKIPTSQIPAIATTATIVVATAAARLALTAAQVQSDDRVVQTNNPGRGTYFLTGTDRTQESSWTLAVAPTDVVQSVNGQSGVVVLGKGDVGLGNADNTSDANKPVSTAQATALAGKVANAAGKTITIWEGTQAAYDALPSATKNAVGFIGHIR
ncbi:hypothetical protein [Rhodococcus sp. UNC363MFTsu5.1]|uniref:hypothetical protein n=1 Tax=Rhodococcus sp. UNC363MFTsu5.1 TaxID=1449069 RepID=UPI00068CCBC6|nr:hypothetical protein [Rhodococcus sp. UNC363MFTsu5.1]